jgi:hypothetical protein
LACKRLGRWWCAVLHPSRAAELFSLISERLPLYLFISAHVQLAADVLVGKAVRVDVPGADRNWIVRA